MLAGERARSVCVRALAGQGEEEAGGWELCVRLREGGEAVYRVAEAGEDGVALVRKEAGEQRGQEEGEDEHEQEEEAALAKPETGHAKEAEAEAEAEVEVEVDESGVVTRVAYDPAFDVQRRTQFTLPPHNGPLLSLALLPHAAEVEECGDDGEEEEEKEAEGGTSCTEIVHVSAQDGCAYREQGARIARHVARLATAVGRRGVPIPGLLVYWTAVPGHLPRACAKWLATEEATEPADSIASIPGALRMLQERASQLAMAERVSQHLSRELALAQFWREALLAQHARPAAGLGLRSRIRLLEPAQECTVEAGGAMGGAEPHAFLALFQIDTVGTFSASVADVSGNVGGGREGLPPDMPPASMTITLRQVRVQGVHTHTEELPLQQCVKVAFTLTWPPSEVAVSCALRVDFASPGVAARIRAIPSDHHELANGGSGVSVPLGTQQFDILDWCAPVPAAAEMAAAPRPACGYSGDDAVGAAAAVAAAICDWSHDEGGHAAAREAALGSTSYSTILFLPPPPPPREEPSAQRATASADWVTRLLQQERWWSATLRTALGSTVRLHRMPPFASSETVPWALPGDDKAGHLVLALALRGVDAVDVIAVRRAFLRRALAAAANPRGQKMDEADNVSMADGAVPLYSLPPSVRTLYTRIQRQVEAGQHEQALEAYRAWRQETQDQLWAWS